MTRGRSRLAIVAVALALLVIGCASAAVRHQGSGSGGGVSTPDRTRSGANAARNFRSETTYQGTPEPVQIEIPRIGVSSNLIKLGKKKDGTVETKPLPWAVAGWYKGGPIPGDPGSAVIMGHVDSKATGPAVFYRLRELRPGDQVLVKRTDGSVVRFAVDRTAQFPKASFPTDEVYYPTLTPELRLITCGGSFDDATGHYRSNIIVFAKLER
ncbi:MAG TPA: class F sortase [Actinomycetes bacterium]